MFKKIFIFFLMFMYLYTLAFNVFMTSVFRIPSSIVFTLPLIFLFGKPTNYAFLYKRQVVFLFISAILLYLVAQQSIVLFAAVIIISICCSLYFNYFIGTDLNRLKLSVIIFYGLLAFSSFIMLMNHRYGAPIDSLRSKLIGELVQQSPSGVTPWVFSFGYQLAALVTFAVVAASAYRKNLIFQGAVFGICMVLILYGMNRSVLVSFLFGVVLFWLFFYRLKVVVIFGFLIASLFIFNSAIEDLSTGRKQNILAKNEITSNEKRSDLMVENLKIIQNYPFGLIFHGKTWGDVARYNPAFKRGGQGIVTSHNAYLMFITYLGIVLGVAFLLVLYYPVMQVISFMLKNIRKKENALLVSLCFSFLAVSLNSFFHNEWLISGSGPTLFTYFAILHLYKIEQMKKQEEK